MCIFKYLQIAKISFLNRSYYRFEILFDAIKAIVVVFVINAVWKEIYSSGSQIAQFSFDKIVIYTCVASVLSLLFNVDISNYMSNKIRRGDIAMELVKPVNYFLYCFSEHLGWVLYSLLFCIVPTFFTLVLIFRMDSIGFLLSPSFLLTTFFGFFLYYCFCRICALTTFYTIEAWGIEYFRINLVRFFAGGFIPISAFPAVLKDVSNYLPFQYMIYQPARAAADAFPEDQLGFVLLVQFIWICILLAIDQLIWKTVVRKIIVHGG